MFGSSVKYVVFRVVIVISVPFRYIEAEVADSKCSQERTDFYEKCILNYEKMSLWCDRTNFSSVPHPKHHLIDTQVPAERTTSIYLNDSCVEKLDAAILRQYISLEYFNCNDNEITTIGANTFADNGHLETLILSNNKISSLNDNAFAGLLRLTVLDLRENQLTEINQCVFDQANNLRTLDLSNNRLEQIHYHAFLHLQRLQEVYLAGNSLTSISNFQFSGLLQLSVVDLHDNNISEVMENIFLSNTDLTSIDLSSNNISCLPKSILMGNNDISLLKLNDNSLTKPKPEWFRKILRRNRRDQVSSNLLSGNKWSCDCASHQYWYFLLNDVPMSWRSLLNIECSSPEQHRGKMINSISKDYFAGCSVDHSGCDNPDLPPIPPSIHTHASTTSSVAKTTIKLPDDENTTISESVKKLLGEVNTMQIGEENQDGNSDKYKINEGIGNYYLVIILCVVAFVFVVIIIKCKFKKSSKSDGNKSSTDEFSLTLRNDSDEGFSEEPHPQLPHRHHQRTRTVSEPSESSNNRAYRARTMSGSSGLTSYSQLSNEIFIESSSSRISMDENTVPKTFYRSDRFVPRRSHDSGNYSTSEEITFDPYLVPIPEATHLSSNHTYHEIPAPPQEYFFDQVNSSTPLYPGASHPLHVDDSNYPPEHLQQCSFHTSKSCQHPLSSTNQCSNHDGYHAPGLYSGCVR